MKISDVEVIEFRTISRSRPSRWTYGVWCDEIEATGADILSTKPGLGFELNWDYIDDNRMGP